MLIARLADSGWTAVPGFAPDTNDNYSGTRLLIPSPLYPLAKFANLQTINKLASYMSNLAQYKSGFESQLSSTSDPIQRASLQLQINEADSNMRQIASQGKDALAVLYQQTGNPEYQNAFQALTVATSGNEIAGALTLPGGAGGNLGRTVEGAKGGVGVNGGAALAGEIATPMSSGGTANTVNGARLNMQLTAEQAAGTRAPTIITSYSDHAVRQIGGRDGGIGVSQAAVNDAFANPVIIQYIPNQYGPTFKYIVKNATVVVNSEGNVVTTWGTNSTGTGK